MGKDEVKSTVGQAASLSLESPAQAASLSSAKENDRQAACPTLPVSDYFNPFAMVGTHRRHLPHWRQDSAWYFVTYRLADSLPRSSIAALEAERKQWLATHPEPRSDEDMKEYWDRFGGRVHDLLDAGSGECWLRRSDVQGIVTESLLFGAGNRYQLDTWVVMPNHVHALVMPMNAIDLSKILHSWKSFTANRINRVLQRTGKLWQDESYNHIVRNPAAFQKIREYILNNPAKAKLREGEYKVAQAASLCAKLEAQAASLCSNEEK